MCEQSRQSHRRLRKLARQEPMIERFTALPGVKWVRAATFFAMIDTPYRFRKKSALWRYVGIGLERKQSGKGPVMLGVPRQCNRVLKGTLLGAAKSAIAAKAPGTAGKNPFARMYERLVHDGNTPRIARRTVARAMAATMWGMWKSSSDYRADFVGVSQQSLTTASHAQG
jgi:transposase